MFAPGTPGRTAPMIAWNVVRVFRAWERQREVFFSGAGDPITFPLLLELERELHRLLRELCREMAGEPGSDFDAPEWEPVD